MRSQQALQLLQSSYHLAATIGPRTGTISCISGLLKGIIVDAGSAGVSANQIRGLSAEALPAVNDQASASSAVGASPAEGQAPTTTTPAAAAAAVAAPADAAPASEAAATAATNQALHKPRKDNYTETRRREQTLKDAGLWIPRDALLAMSPEQQSQVHQQQQQYLWKMKQQQRLQGVTSCNMLVQMSPELQQLEVVVTATAVAGAIGKKRAASIAVTAAAEAEVGSSSSTTGDNNTSRAYSSSGDSGGDDADIQQQQQQPATSSSNGRQQSKEHQQQQQRQRQVQFSADRLARLQQQQRGDWSIGSRAYADIAAAAAADSVESATDSRRFAWRFTTSPGLDHRSLVKQSRETRIINLNSQFTTLHETAGGHSKIIELFDEMIEKGMQEAQQQQQQQQGDEQKQQQQQQPERAGVLVLPRQYCPDYQALAAYCRSLVALTETYSVERKAADVYSSDSAPRSSIARAERAAALWGSYQLSRQTPGMQVHLALLASYIAAGRANKAVNLYYRLRATNSSNSGMNSYRLHAYGVQAAVVAKNFPAADELARMFSSNVIAYTESSYKHRLVRLYRSLATGAAACGEWEKAMYWLQELINNYTLVPVQPGDFFSVMMHAAKSGRMDYVRMLMTAADQQMNDQHGKPVIYNQEQLKYLIEAAGHARDVDFIETLWQRLLLDAVPSTTSSSSSGSNSSRSEARPSAHAYKTIIRALVDSEHWSKALNLVVEFDQAYGEAHTGPGRDFAAVSVFDGLSFFPTALEKESQVAAVFEAVKARKDAGLPVTTTLMNIVCRSIARLGNTEAAGKVFQSYGVWGIPHDADSYNAIMECCEINKKVVGAESLVSYMTSKGIKPNTNTWNILLSTAVHAGDRRAVVSALERIMAAGCTPRAYLVKRAKEMSPRDRQLTAAVNKAIEKYNLKVPLVPRVSTWRQQPQRGPQNAEVWTPSTGPLRRGSLQQQWQQPQQQQQYDDEGQLPWQHRDQPQDEQWQQQRGDEQQQGDSSSDEKAEASGIRSQLRDAFGR